MRISLPREKPNDKRRLLLDRWPVSRGASAWEERSQRGEEVVESHVRTASGQVFRMELVAMTGLHDASARRKKEPHGGA